MKTQNRNSRRCDIHNIDVHRASYVKDLKNKKHSPNEKKIPSNCFNESN